MEALQFEDALIVPSALTPLNSSDENTDLGSNVGQQPDGDEDGLWTPSGYFVLNPYGDNIPIDTREVSVEIDGETQTSAEYTIKIDGNTNFDVDPNLVRVEEGRVFLVDDNQLIRNLTADIPLENANVIHAWVSAPITLANAFGIGQPIPSWEPSGFSVLNPNGDNIPIDTKEGEFAVMHQGNPVILTYENGDPLTVLTTDISLENAYVAHSDPDQDSQSLGEFLGAPGFGDGDDDDGDQSAGGATWTPTPYEVVTGWLDGSGSNVSIPIETDGAGKYAVMHNDGTNTQYMILTDPTGTPLTELNSHLGYFYSTELRTAFVENPDGGGQMLFELSLIHI